jgi:hypothetical protein
MAVAPLADEPAQGATIMKPRFHHIAVLTLLATLGAPACVTGDDPIDDQSDGELSDDDPGDIGPADSMDRRTLTMPDGTTADLVPLPVQAEPEYGYVWDPGGCYTCSGLRNSAANSCYYTFGAGLGWYSCAPCNYYSGYDRIYFTCSGGPT